MAETTNTPICDKCGIEIISGMQFACCPHKQECELYPKDANADTRAFADFMQADSSEGKS